MSGKVLQPFHAGTLVGSGIMVREVVGEDFVEHFEFALAGDFFAPALLDFDVLFSTHKYFVLG
ncbi:MAG: hypothetical protein ACR2GR_05375 [Rhodothermales bacterium]